MLLHDVKRLGRKLEVLNGGKEHAATLTTAQALMGQHIWLFDCQLPISCPQRVRGVRCYYTM